MGVLNAKMQIRHEPFTDSRKFLPLWGLYQTLIPLRWSHCYARWQKLPRELFQKFNNDF